MHIEQKTFAAPKYAGVAELNQLPTNCPVHRFSGEWWWFARLFVQPEYRNTGIATSLMNDVVDWADEKHIAILCTVNAYGDLDTNQLVKFYKKFGFEVEEPPATLIRIPRRRLVDPLMKKKGSRVRGKFIRHVIKIDGRSVAYPIRGYRSLYVVHNWRKDERGTVVLRRYGEEIYHERRWLYFT